MTSSVPPRIPTVACSDWAAASANTSATQNIENPARNRWRLRSGPATGSAALAGGGWFPAVAGARPGDVAGAFYGPPGQGPVQPAGQGPVGRAEQVHQRGHQQAADDQGVDQDGEREREAELLQDAVPAEQERPENQDHDAARA